jgi:alkylmercury lyase-like protein
VRELPADIGDLHLSPVGELSAEVDQELRDVRSALELVLDAGQGAAALPERARLAGAALGVSLRDELDRAELPVLSCRLHTGTMPPQLSVSIGPYPLSRAESYGAWNDPVVDEFDLEVRRHVYFSIVASGRPPTTAEAATALGSEQSELEDAYLRLHAAHALVLHPDSHAIWMANPFCFSPTPHRVRAGGQSWAGTCAWDALGIPGALHTDGFVESECACCGEPLELDVVDGELAQGRNVLVHFLVPARRWWDDIGFT